MKQILRYLLLYVLVVAVQVLLLDNVNVNGFGTPLVYVGLIIVLPYGVAPSLKLLIGFLLGAVVDICSGCAGVHAAATTATAMLYILSIDKFIPKEDMRLYELLTPSPQSMGWSSFFRFTLLMVMVHHTFLYAVEAMSLAHPLLLGMRIVLSGLTTLSLILLTEYYLSRR